MEQIKDTKALQIKSVINFMYVLGYDYSDWTSDFIDRRVHSATSLVSFNTAAFLHNNPIYLELTDSPFLVTKYTYNLACAAKIVETAKLQCTKHGSIKVQSHKVRFLDEEYYDLFLGDEK